jgi:hypothetical protein
MDASDFVAGAVLSQVQDGVEKVIAYWSKGWTKSQKNYSVTRREMLASLLAMEAFRYYLLGLENFDLRTDHACLRWLRNHKSDEPMVNRWLQRFSAFNFTVVHRAGAKHGNADALSRKPCDGCGLCQHEGEPCNPDQGVVRVANATQYCFTEAGAPHMSKKKARRRRMRAKRPVHAPVPDGEYTIWTPSIVAQHQREDEVLGSVMGWLESGGARPEWVDVSLKSSTLKYWWARFNGPHISSQGVLQLAWADRQGNQA